MTDRLLARAARIPALALVLAGLAQAQRAPEQLDAAAILHRLAKLEVVGSVLYVAAHPDDENTRLISHLSNGRKVRTAYLSLTRGDGGQNLIGPDLGDALGVLRTQELLEARRIDGGEQYFTRAVDFGYSKSADETFAKWGREEILADVVRVVREFRPDVIVTRFTAEGSGGHGHHTASAVLANEAFELAADPKAFPEQIADGLEPWRTRRLFYNGSSFARRDLAEVAAKDPATWIRVDVGGYDALLGASYTELAGRSRSQHKSQGFGAAETRGEQIEYLHLVKGPPFAGPDLLDGVDLTWSRVAGGEKVRDLLRATIDAYDVRAPEASVPRLAQIARALDELVAFAGADGDRARRSAEVARELVLQAAGVVVEITSAAPRVAAGDTVPVKLSVLQRRAGPEIRVLDFAGPGGATIAANDVLAPNRPLVKELALSVPAATSFDEPYWLAHPHAALYRPDRARHAGIEPVVPGELTFRGALRLADGTTIPLVRGAVHTWVDRVDGERARPVVVTPVASVEPVDGVALVSGAGARVTVDVEALADDLSGELSVVLPEGWSVERAPAPVEGLARGARARLVVDLARTPQAVGGVARFTFAGPKGASSRTLRVVDHQHVQPQTWYEPAEVALVPQAIAVSAKVVGYVEGAGDEVPAALRRLGVDVETIDPRSARAEDLSKYDAIVTGIRAYNTDAALVRFQPALLAYVESGGTLVVQYVTNGSDLLLEAQKIGPRPFALTRQRVTVEEAPPTFLAPAHPLMNVPNALSATDFEGWIQERGLYFAGELDPAYTALVAWNDPGEQPQNGAWIVCDHGKGRFVYTGLSLFRQLPAGVPGAYRILANLVARRTNGA